MEIINWFVVIIGAVIGSFLNVCIYRLPRGESIISPRSYCPACKASVPFYYNVPILSYIILRGKCHNCKAAIPVSYPFVEFLTAILLVTVWHYYGPGPFFLHYSVLFLLLLLISFIDIDFKLILNVLTLPGMVLGVLMSTIATNSTLVESGLGLISGGGFLLLIGLAGKSIFGQESMGGGDVKLGAMIGAFLGPKVVIALFLAFFIALPVVLIGLGTRRLKVGGVLPFGPFISLGTVVLVIFGNSLYGYYLNLFN